MIMVNLDNSQVAATRSDEILLALGADERRSKARRLTKELDTKLAGIRLSAEQQKLSLQDPTIKVVVIRDYKN